MLNKVLLVMAILAWKRGKKSAFSNIQRSNLFQRGYLSRKLGESLMTSRNFYKKHPIFLNLLLYLRRILCSLKKVQCLFFLQSMQNIENQKLLLTFLLDKKSQQDKSLESNISVDTHFNLWRQPFFEENHLTDLKSVRQQI